MSITKETLDDLKYKASLTPWVTLRDSELLSLIAAVEEAETLHVQLAEKDAMLGKCVREAFEAGYGTAHNHTVEGHYAPEDSAHDYMTDFVLPTTTQEVIAKVQK
jgi:hypothetical protein